MLEDIYENTEGLVQKKDNISAGEIVIGSLVEINNFGEPCVKFEGVSESLKSISTISITKEHIGKQVALLFANGDLEHPVIMGLIHNPLAEILENYDQSQSSGSETKNDTQALALESNLKIDDVLIDGKRITFEAKEQIVLRCGESSITLTKAGKILIRGKYLLNRSTGVNRIMGGSVQVN